MRLSIYHEHGEELERRLRLKTFPLAVKMVEREADIPEGATRPKGDLGYRINACQAFAISRREGTAVAQLKEDMWCCEPVIGYGLAEPPEYFMQGYNRFPQDVKNLDAGRVYAQAFPRLECGKYIGIVSTPLTTTNFDPDLVMIYCDSEQLTLLLLGVAWSDGYEPTCKISGHAACVYSIVPLMQGQQCQVAVPCRGDHGRAAALGDELIFTLKKERLEDLILGLRHLDSYGYKLPIAHPFPPEHEQPAAYMKLAEMLGMRDK